MFNNQVSSDHFGTHNLYVHQRLLSLVCFLLVYITNRLDTFDHSSKNCVLVVQPRTGYHCNEKLRTICIRSTICHRQHIRPIESILLWPKLILEHSSPYRLSSCSVTFGTSTLNHESFDDSMENHPIIVALFDQFYEIFASLRTIFQVKQEVNVSHGCLENDFVLFLSYLWLKHCGAFLASLSLVYNISNHCVFWFNLWHSSRKYVKSWSPERSSYDNGVGCLSLSLDICISVGISHLFPLKQGYSDKSLVFFAANGPLYALVRK